MRGRVGDIAVRSKKGEQPFRVASQATGQLVACRPPHFASQAAAFLAVVTGAFKKCVV